MTLAEYPLVLAPRYTAHVGSGIYVTVGLDVTPFKSAIVTVWRGNLIGTSANFGVTLEESSDQETWSVCTGTTPSTDPGANNEVLIDPTLDKQYFRIKMILNGANAGVTWFATGSLQSRKA